MNLNPSQVRAASFGSGPCLVLAGPGSGKTTVMVSRIQHLITDLKVPPGQILAVTFSRAAANEMATRYSSRDGVTFGTLHSIFLKILKEERPGELKLISERQRYNFIRSEIEKYSLPYESADTLCRDILLLIGRIKSGQMDITDPTLQGKGAFLSIYTDYSVELRRSGLIDFDDIITGCQRLLMQRPGVLSKWQDRFRYILIDEFQDISETQYETIRLLAGPSANVFAVGDDDQSIYGFRGAGGGIMRRFLDDYPVAETIVLNINYRSGSDILDAALSVISENEGRFDKALSPANAGGTVSLREFGTRRQEYESMIRNITGLKGQSVAVLFRNNEDSSLFAQMLGDAGISFSYSGKRPAITDHFAVQDMIAYLKTALCLLSRSLTPCRAEILRIMNRPSRYISRDSLNLGSGITATADGCLEALVAFYRNNSRMHPVISRFSSDLLLLADLPPAAAVKFIRHAIGYEKWLMDYSFEKHIDPAACTLMLDQFEDYAGGFGTINELLEAIRSGTDSCGDTLDNSCKTSGNISPDVQILTMHASKGMEFDVVFLPDSNDSIIPNKKSVKAASGESGLKPSPGMDPIEEERRLFYVAMTRARSGLHISWVKRLHNKEAYPTRFINKLL